MNKKQEHKEKEGEVKSEKKRKKSEEEGNGEINGEITVALSISKAKHERGNLGASLLTYACNFHLYNVTFYHVTHVP